MHCLKRMWSFSPVIRNIVQRSAICYLERLFLPSSKLKRSSEINSVNPINVVIDTTSRSTMYWIGLVPVLGYMQDTKSRRSICGATYRMSTFSDDCIDPSSQCIRCTFSVITTISTTASFTKSRYQIHLPTTSYPWIILLV
jgi:hypothetical protein